MTPKKVLVIGASGVIGGAHIRNLAGRDEVTALALSRRPEEPTAANVSALAMDLIAPAQVDHQALADVSHMVFAGFIETGDMASQRAPNRALFEAALFGRTGVSKACACDLTARHEGLWKPSWCL